MTTRFCPECNDDLTRWSIRSHALTHWPPNLPDRPEIAQARARQAQLLEWAEEQEHAEATHLPPLSERAAAGLPDRPSPTP